MFTQSSAAMSIPFTIPAALLVASLLASCSMTQPVAQRDDDVYYMPSQARPKAVAAEQPEPAAVAPATDDYYDSGTSQELGTNQNYYDMAYNDPYYYNYGRFGFNSAPMGWQTGWNGPGWGMGYGSGWGTGIGFGSGYFGSGWNMSVGYGWGYGTGVYSGWWRPNYSLGFGYGWGSPWGNGYSPFAWYNDPYYYGYGGYGWGNYWGPFGRCGYYYPVSVGNVVVAHRGGLTHVGANGTNDLRQPRMAVRNPVSLQPAVSHRSVSDASRGTLRQPARSTGQPTYRPGTVNREPVRQQPVITRSPGQDRPSRGTFESRPSFDRGGGGSMPSRGGGGGGGGSAPMRRAR